MNFAIHDERLMEIDERIEASGHRLNPTTMRFERFGTGERDRSRSLDISAEVLRKAHLVDVEKEEFWEYMRWKRACLTGRHSISRYSAFA